MIKIKYFLLALLFSPNLIAGVIMFTDRSEWEFAATSMGLTVATGDFSNSPNLFSETPVEYYDATGSFTLQGTNWDIQVVLITLPKETLFRRVTGI